MRFRVDVAAAKPVIPWGDLHGAAHAVVYDLLRSQEPTLAGQLHDKGWSGSSLRPVGISPPLFAGTKTKPGAYTTSDQGTIWLGAPVPEIAAALLAGVAGRTELRWGSVPLTVKGVQLEPATGEEDEQTLTTVSPVLVKRASRFLLPGDDGYLAVLTHNLRHKADLLGLPNEVEVEILETGPRRRYEVSGGLRIGATVTVRLAGDPRTLGALREWGLGLGTIQGFGWVR